MSFSLRWVRILSLASILGASACATVGEKEFSCPGRPKGVSCLSATDVYKATDNSEAVKSTTKEQEEATAKTPNFIRTSTVLPAVDKPIPIRTPAQVMRVWMAPWEDTRGILHAGGYSFIEIESRRWSFGETPLQTEPVRLFSIQKATPETKKEPVGKSPTARATQASISERSNKPSSITSSYSGASK